MMAKITVTVCDVCESDEGVSTWVVKKEGTREIDLCEAHSQPLAALWGAGRVVGRQPTKKAPKAPQKRSGKPARKGRVMSLEEIEALKK